MSTFAPMVTATYNVWNVAEQELAKLNAINTDDMKAYSTALLTAQQKVAIATSVEQKASAAIDKAFQAHSQVASK